MLVLAIEFSKVQSCVRLTIFVPNPAKAGWWHRGRRRAPLTIEKKRHAPRLQNGTELVRLLTLDLARQMPTNRINLG
jgi:hypothetical protein